MNRTPPASRRAFRGGAALLLLGLLARPDAPLADEQTPLLRLQGSNTLNAHLTPSLLTGLLQQRGYLVAPLAQGSDPDEWHLTARSGAGQQVEVVGGAHGTGTGFTALLAGQADLAAASRPIKDAEYKALANLGDLRAPDAEQVVGLDGLAIIVNPANPLRRLNLQQVAQLFAGEITDWRELGGPPGPIHVQARDERSGTWDTFRELVLTPSGKALVSGAQRYESNDQLAAKVAHDPQAIGFTSFSAIGNARPLALSDGDGLAILPSEASIATEDYPLARRLYFYAPQQGRSPWAQALLDYTQSPAGQALVQGAGFVAQRIEPLDQQVAGNLPKAYRDLARHAKRLTVNFRFAAGSAQLDSKANRDVERLATYLKQPEQQARRLVLVGFNDATENPARAELLSKLRATTVANALRRHGVFTPELLALGEQLPVAAQSGLGRVKNRRVEAWVY